MNMYIKYIYFNKFRLYFTVSIIATYDVTGPKVGQQQASRELVPRRITPVSLHDISIGTPLQG